MYFNRHPLPVQSTEDLLVRIVILSGVIIPIIVTVTIVLYYERECKESKVLYFLI